MTEKNQTAFENNQKTAKDAHKSAVAHREERILHFWRAKNVFQKNLERNKQGSEGVKRTDSSKSKEFVFYDGPPFATGEPHYGHILPGTIKDIIPKYKVMRGFYVSRNWGWDCHGLPVENLIEKELNLQSKKDIEQYGIEKFNQKARQSVLRYVDDWKHTIPRTGRFVNMDNAYVTMKPEYTESVWWSFKQLYHKGLVYEGYKIMQVCPRCETTLSNFEVSQNYVDIVDISVYVKFAVEHEPNTFFLAWTTTPWTLPGNTALAVGADIQYVKVELQIIENGTASLQNLILAKERLALIKEPYVIRQEMKGSSLIGKSYKPIFNYYSDLGPKTKNAWKVYGANFVSVNDGTGIVHIAPAFGAEDKELSDNNDIPMIQHVTMHGVFKSEVVDFAGRAVKPRGDHQATDIEIIKYLAHNNALYSKEKITHSYPHCWRCDTPLINYATSSWFIKVTDLRQKMLSENNKVEWVPDHIKNGRFGKWLEGAKDWSVSRSRFWGAPLPVWRCQKCKQLEVLGSFTELKKHMERRNTFWVMRHGQSENNLQNLVNSTLEHNHFHLTKSGVRQAEVSAQKIDKPDIIICSPFTRVQETAHIIAKHFRISPGHIITDERLREINAGIYDGKPISQYHDRFLAKTRQFDFKPEGGESEVQARERLASFLYEINEKYSGKKILLVTHDAPAWLLASVADGLSDSQTVALRQGREFFLQNAEAMPIDVVSWPHNELYELDVHRPYIDDISFKCTNKLCDGKMKRVNEVFDTWYDSGSMSFAQHHYPFENGNLFNPQPSGLKSFLKNIFKPNGKSSSIEKKGFPADFIAEGVDQTRGWFYTLLVLSTGLFGQSPYKNVVVNGLVLAEDGKKMAKRLKNYPEISEVMDKYGADALRFFLMNSPAVRGEDIRFSEKGIDEIYKKVIGRLDNVCSFYEMYIGTGSKDKKGYSFQKSILDYWIITRLRQLWQQVSLSLNAYEVDKAVSPIELFIDDLSTWYLRRSRDRFKSEGVNDSVVAQETLRQVLLELSKIISPFMPFISEDIYQRVAGPRESVHLEDWPTEEFFNINLTGAPVDLLDTMTLVRTIVSEGLEQRSAAKIKVRQPLQSITIGAKGGLLKKLDQKELESLLLEELNIKEVVFKQDQDGVVLDTGISEELRQEGVVREIIRAIQEGRKEKALQPHQKVSITIETDSASALSILKKNLKQIEKAVNAMIALGSVSDSKTEVRIEGGSLFYSISK